MQVICELCGRKEEYDPAKWRCDCGGAWMLYASQSMQIGSIEKDIRSIWRYHSFFPVQLNKKPASLGAGFTPLLPCTLYDREVSLKLDYLMPTGSFKDRGVELMMNVLKAYRVESIAEDSSGNAGAAVAAYAARLGMQADIFAPAHASPAKLSQIALFGANVHTIPGERKNAAEAVLEAVEKGKVYASHAYNPVYLLGQQTAAWEVWEQSGYHAPDWVIVPVGQGGNLLGYFEGFSVLHRANLIDKMPGLIAVQPERLAPICDALQNDWQNWEPVSAPEKGSIAEGLAITNPVRWKHIVKALKKSGGFCVRVKEEDILPARKMLAEKGFYIEPTSAVVIAALKKVINLIERDQTIVVSLTGSGLKSASLPSM